MTHGYNCDFVEQSALMAALSDDDDGLREVLSAMLPGERKALRRACRIVADTVDYLT